MDMQQHLDATLTSLATVLDGIEPADDARPTPCAGTSVADLRGHVVGALAPFVRALEDPDGNGVGAPVPVQGRGGDQVRELVARIVATRGHQPAAVHLGWQPLPLEVAFPMMLDEFLAHGWDLAVATDQEFTADDEACDTATDFIRRRFPTEASCGGMYGPRVEVPADSSALDRCLGEAGRDPQWSAA